MEFHTFGPGLALDPLTMRGVPAMTAYLEDAHTGEPVQAFTMDEDPVETTVRTNRFGYFPQFKVDDTVRKLRILVGEVILEHVAWEVIDMATRHVGPTPPDESMEWLFIDPEYDPGSGKPLPTYTAPNGTITHGELIEWEA